METRLSSTVMPGGDASVSTKTQNHRVSFGPGTLGVALQALRDAVAGLVGHGPLPAALAFRPPG